MFEKVLGRGSQRVGWWKTRLKILKLRFLYWNYDIYSDIPPSLLGPLTLTKMHLAYDERLLKSRDWVCFQDSFFLFASFSHWQPCIKIFWPGWKVPGRIWQACPGSVQPVVISSYCEKHCGVLKEFVHPGRSWFLMQQRLVWCSFELETQQWIKQGLSGSLQPRPQKFHQEQGSLLFPKIDFFINSDIWGCIFFKQVRSIFYKKG